MDQDRYRIVRVLGSGAMGKVSLATELATGRTVAIKVLAREYLGHEEVLARFRREARIQGLIEHPHVVRIHEACFDGPEPFLVMDFVDGVTLEAAIKNGGALPLAEVGKLATQVGSALDLLHGKGVLHRDLKPSNVMIRKADGAFVVMDLGLASMVNATILTSTGQMLGTPLYLPPEVILGKPWSAAGDMFQLGSILFEAATGRRLVQARSMEEVLLAITSGTWSGFPTGPDALPRPVEEGLRLAVSVDPEKRPASGRELAEALRTGALRKASQRLARPALASSMVGAAPAPAAGSPARGRAATAAAGILGLAVVLGWLWPRGPGEIRWEVVGDAVVASWPAPGPEGMTLEVDGTSVPAEATPVDGYRRAVAYGLEPGRQVSAGLVWPGGRAGPRLLKVEGPAVLPGLTLAEGGMVRVEAARGVAAFWKGRPAEIFQLEPGSQRIPLPPGAPESFTLAWSEARVPFERSYERGRLLAAAIVGITARLGPIDPVAEVRGRVGLGKQIGRGLADFRAPLKPLVGWLPEILGGPSPGRARAALFSLYQAWERAVAMERSEGGPDDPIGVPRGLIGSRFSGPAAWKPDECQSARVELEGIGGEYEKGDPRGIPLGVPGNDLLIGSRAARGCEAVRFAWPAGAPVDRRPVILSLSVHKMSQTLALRLVPAGGSPTLELWHPTPGVPPANHLSDWLHLCLPGDLMPAPGSPVTITAGALVRATGEYFRVGEATVSWLR